MRELRTGWCSSCRQVAAGDGSDGLWCMRQQRPTQGYDLCNDYEGIKMATEDTLDIQEQADAKAVTQLIAFDPDEPEWLNAARNASHAALCRALEQTQDEAKREELGNWIARAETRESEPLPTPREMIASTGELLPAIPDTAIEKALAELDAPSAYDKRRVISECRVFVGQSAEAMLEAGKRLIELKDNEPHGEFVRIVEEELILNPRTAQLMMVAAAKFMGPALAGPKTKTFSLLGKSKLFELMTEPDEDLAGLADGGTLAGLALEDIDRMSVRELKAALRAHKAEAAQKLAETEGSLEASRNLNKRNVERIAELEEQLEIRKKAPPPPPEMIGRKAQQVLADRTLALIASVTTEFLRDAGPVLTAHSPRTIQAETAVAMAAGQIIAAVRDVCRTLEVLPADDAGEAFAQASGDAEKAIWKHVTNGMAGQAGGQ
jgi:hypothetical protein